MKRYFVLESSRYIDYGITRSPKLGSESVLAGRLVEKTKLPSLVVEHNFPSGHQMPDLLEESVVVVSQRFVQLLKSIGVDNFQIFPVTLINPDIGEESGEYFLFNVVGLMRVASLDDSDYDELMPASPDGANVPLVAFNKIAIYGENTYDIDMFRLAEDPGSLIVSEFIVEALKKNKPDEGWGVTIEEVDLVN